MRLMTAVVMIIAVWFMRKCLLYWVIMDGDDDFIVCYF